MRASRWLILCSCLAAFAFITFTLQTRASGSSPRVRLSNTGMEGVTEVKVQVHLSADQGWRALVDLDEQKLEKTIQEQVRRIPRLKLIKGEASEQTPRLLVIVVGNIIADPQGNKDTCATNIIMALSQPVSVRWSLPTGSSVITTGMTWHRSILLTGVKEKMRERVHEKFSYLAGQFGEEYTRANTSK